VAKPKQPAARRAYLSVSRAMYETLDKVAERTGAPIGILVELAVSRELGVPLSKQAREWAERLSSIFPAAAQLVAG
jgi:hypothetical protein